MLHGLYTRINNFWHSLWNIKADFGSALFSFFFIKSKSKSEKKKKAHCNVHVNKNVWGIRISRHKKTPQKTPTVIHIMFLNLNLFHVVDKKKTRDLRSVVFKCYLYVRLKNKELVRKKRKWVNYLVNLLPWRLQRELIAFIGTAPQCYRFPIEFGDPSYQPPLYNPPRIIASRCALFLYETHLIYVLTTDVEVQICIKDGDRGWGAEKVWFNIWMVIDKKYNGRWPLYRQVQYTERNVLIQN